MWDKSREFLENVYIIVGEIIKEKYSDVQEILASLNIRLERYQQIVTQEVVEDFYSKVPFALSSPQDCKPEDLEKGARYIILQKIARDKRIFLSSDGKMS